MKCPGCDKDLGPGVFHHACPGRKIHDRQGKPLGKAEFGFDTALRSLEAGHTVYMTLPNEQ